MASLDFTLSWSLEVSSVEVLGAHLQAYVELQPTFQALRLCNRYGQGSHAAVTKLPIELMKEIEGHLMKYERKKRRKNWATDFRCFQGLCRPIEHMSDSEQVELWLDVHCGEAGCLDCLCSDSEVEAICVGVAKLNAHQQTRLVEFLDAFIADNGPERSSWWDEHQIRCGRWQRKTGTLTGRVRGLLSDYSATLLRDFGLDLWVAHTQPSKAKQGQFTVTEVFASTIVYLTLPCAKTRKTIQRGYSEFVGENSGSPWLQTESGGGVLAAIPTPLSKKNRLRFTRAMRILDLAASSRNDAEAESGNAEEDDEAGDAEADPKLRILYLQGVDDQF